MLFAIGVIWQALFCHSGKKGAIEMEEIIKIIIAVVFLVVLVLIALALFKGKGGAALDSIKNLLHLGRG